MALYKTITVNAHTKVLIWKIEESFEELDRDIQLTEHCQQRLDSMRSEIHQRGFLSVRHLLAELGYTDFDLFYDERGKPHLKDGKHIDIDDFSMDASKTRGNVYYGNNTASYTLDFLEFEGFTCVYALEENRS
jgi:hypothetical protein